MLKIEFHLTVIANWYFVIVMTTKKFIISTKVYNTNNINIDTFGTLSVLCRSTRGSMNFVYYYNTFLFAVPDALTKLIEYAQF